MQREPIAIIGMACIFPKARDVDAFWQNILGKVDAVSDPPPGAWDTSLSYDPDSGDVDRIYCKRGGFLGDLAVFDPLEHGIPPVGVGGDPDQWLALRIARDALVDAGYGQLDEETRHRTAVILGRGALLNQTLTLPLQHSLIIPQTLEIVKALQPDLSDSQIERLREALHESLPPLGPELMTGMVPNMIAGRIANRLDLMGPSYTIDAACASSLVALQLAARDLLNGDCDLALAGGSHIWTPVPLLAIFCQLGALSRRQEIRPFDKDADGTILGEGLGMLVLKRLSDAERDNDRIYAVIRGIGVSSDGRAMGMMTPRVDGEELAIRRAYESAGVPPQSVRLIEAHGTATAVGDATEVQALTRIFGQRQGLLPPIALGSVKSMISHTVPAAGAAGMIKTALALYHKVLPPTINVTELNPRLELEKTPFYINTEPRPWIHGEDGPRRAGVSAFGFGGINAHVVLEEYVPSGAASRATISAPPWRGATGLSEKMPPRDSEVCVIEGASPADLAGRAERLQQYVARAAAVEESGARGAVRLEDVAYTLSLDLAEGAPAGPRLAIVATTLTDLREKLQTAVERLRDPSTRQIRERSGIYYTATPLAAEGKIAFLMSGEGSQYANMLADVCLHFPEARQAFDRGDAIFKAHGREHVPSDFVFPRASFFPEEAEWASRRLWEVDGAIASVLAADEALLSVLSGLGVKPDALLGHSAGEWAALNAAGVFGADAEARSTWRALHEFYEQTMDLGGIRPAAMVAVGAGREDIERLLHDLGCRAAIALDNCPHQVVLAIEPEDAERFLEAAGREGWISERLSFDRPYHTPMYQPYADRLDATLQPVALHAPGVPVYSCATASPFPGEPDAVRALMAGQWVHSVDFRSTIEAMHRDGVRLFVEVGPRGLLTAFVEDILRGKPYAAIASNLQQRAGVTQIMHMAAMLAAHGSALDLTYLFRWRNPVRVDWQADPEALVQRGRVLLNIGFPMMKLDSEAGREIAGPTPVRAAPQPRVETPAPESNGHAPPAEASPGTGAYPAASTVIPSARGNGSAAAPGPQVAPAPQPARGASTGVSVAAHDFLNTMEQFLAVQENVMRGFLGARPAASAPPSASPQSPPLLGLPAAPLQASSSPAPSAAPDSVEGLSAAPRLAGIAPAAPGADSASTAAADPAVLGELLVGIVSERTGYPVEAIQLDADLEADLGIDSIKRVEIIGTLRQRSRLADGIDVEQLTAYRSLGQIIAALSSTSAAKAPAAPPGRSEEDSGRPLLGSVVEHQRGRRLVTRRVFDPDRQDVFLLHHTIGRAPSLLDPSLPALSVMPLAMSLEILAEAAAALLPELVVTGLRDVRAHRWLAFDRGPQTIEIVAERLTDGSVYACLRSPDEEGGIAVEATVAMAPAYPASVLPAVELGPGRESALSKRLYKDLMFHGPAWAPVKSLLSTGEDGIRATLETLPPSTLLRTPESPALAMDPVVLDAVGQVLGFWTVEHLSQGWLIFPNRADVIEVLGPRLPPGAPAVCTVRVTQLEEQQIRADIDVDDASGKPWLRVRGWVNKRFYLPDLLRRLIIPPEGSVEFCSAWRELVEHAPDGVKAEAVRLQTDVAADVAFLARIWAMRILSRQEREEFATLPAGIQIDWLCRRQAVKEATLRLLRREAGLELQPADISVNEAGGSVRVDGPWTALTSEQVNVAVAREGDVAVAAASFAPLQPVLALSRGDAASAVAALGPQAERQAASSAVYEGVAATIAYDYGRVQ